LIFKAWESLPGPEVKDNISSVLRKVIILSIPSKGCKALMSTAPALSLFDRAETFTQN
jgi:hypothetical protein